MNYSTVLLSNFFFLIFYKLFEQEKYLIILPNCIDFSNGKIKRKNLLIFQI